VKPKGEYVKSGIIIPDLDSTQIEEADVVAVGPGKYAGDGSRIPMQTRPGDRILFNRFQSQLVRIPGDPVDYLALRDTDVRAVMNR
jgi:chaperonin GroES